MDINIMCVYLSVSCSNLYSLETKHFAENQTNFPIDFNLTTILYNIMMMRKDGSLYVYRLTGC